MEILEPRVTPWYLPEGQHLKLVCATPVRTDINNIAWEKNGQIIDQNAMNGYFVETKVARGEFISTLEKEVTTKEDGDSYLCHPTGQPSQGYNVVVNMFTCEWLPSRAGSLVHPISSFLKECFFFLHFSNFSHLPYTCALAVSVMLSHFTMLL